MGIRDSRFRPAEIRGMETPAECAGDDRKGTVGAPLGGTTVSGSNLSVSPGSAPQGELLRSRPVGIHERPRMTEAFTNWTPFSASAQSGDGTTRYPHSHVGQVPKTG